MAGRKIREDTIRCNLTLGAGQYRTLQTMAERGGTSLTQAVGNFIETYGNEYLKTLEGEGGSAEENDLLDLGTMFARLKGYIRDGAMAAAAEVRSWMDAEHGAARAAESRAAGGTPTRGDTIRRLMAGITARLDVDYSGSDTEGGRLLRTERAFIALIGSVLNERLLKVYSEELSQEDAGVLAEYTKAARRQAIELRELREYRERGEQRSQAAKDRWKRRAEQDGHGATEADWKAARERRAAGRMVHTADGWKTVAELTDYERRVLINEINKRNESNDDYIQAAETIAEGASATLERGATETDEEWERRTAVVWAGAWLKYSGEEQYI